MASEATSPLSRVPIRDAAVGRMAEPPLPDDVDVRQLDRDVRADLRSLSIGTADTVAKHLVVAGSVIDEDPALALKHARFARSIAARVGAVREAVGVAAYHAGEWAEALAELRAARRITGDPRWIAVMADCERALDRPQRAVKVLEDPDLGRVDAATRAEVLIVAAGARRDMGQDEAALLLLSSGNIDRSRPQPGVGRLWYAYADLLDHMGRTEEARSWFAAVARLDDDETDADERAGWDG
jgi:tetratricopeptide (TPR) repeat protein